VPDPVIVTLEPAETYPDIFCKVPDEVIVTYPCAKDNPDKNKLNTTDNSIFIALLNLIDKHISCQSSFLLWLLVALR